MLNKKEFEKLFLDFIKELQEYCVDIENNWKIKGFIDIEKTIFSISKDTKLISKILEIHILPKLLELATKNGFDIVLPSSQNYYPDLTFIYKKDNKIKYAVDIKTTFIKDSKKDYCIFTLGSHGAYFTNRQSTKNIEFPYKEYCGHFVLGIIYKQAENIDDTKIYKIEDLQNILSVIKDLKIFFIEKWKIANDRQGSGNTANIGGILKKESDMINGNGIFKNDKEFNDYWMNYGKISIADEKGNIKKITKLSEFRKYKNNK